MGLGKVDLLMLFRFPLFNQQKLIGIGFRQIIVVLDAAVLCPNSIQNTCVFYLLDKSLPLLGQALIFYISQFEYTFLNQHKKDLSES